MIETHILDDLNGPPIAQKRLSKSDFARLIKVSPGRISQLIGKGLPVEHDGLIDIARGKLWIMENVDANRSKAQPHGAKDLFDLAGMPSSVNEAKARLTAAQADAAEIRTAALRGEMVKASDVEREWSETFRKVRAGMLALPSRVRQHLPHLSQHEVTVIADEVRQILTELADDR